MSCIDNIHMFFLTLSCIDFWPINSGLMQHCTALLSNQDFCLIMHIAIRWLLLVKNVIGYKCYSSFKHSSFVPLWFVKHQNWSDAWLVSRMWICVTGYANQLNWKKNRQHWSLSFTMYSRLQHPSFFDEQ